MDLRTVPTLSILQSSLLLRKPFQSFEKPLDFLHFRSLETAEPHKSSKIDDFTMSAPFKANSKAPLALLDFLLLGTSEMGESHKNPKIDVASICWISGF